MTTHTPVPWKKVEGIGIFSTNMPEGKNIAIATTDTLLRTDRENEANTDFILKAVDNHESLLEAVEFLINESKGRGIHIKDGISFQKARDAIKKAKGE